MITIKLFGTLRLKTGCKGLEASFPEVSTVKDACQRLADETGIPAKEFKRSVIAINGKPAKHTTPLQDGDEIAFFSPSGGG